MAKAILSGSSEPVLSLDMQRISELREKLHQAYISVIRPEAVSRKAARTLHERGCDTDSGLLATMESALSAEMQFTADLCEQLVSLWASRKILMGVAHG